MHHFPFHISDIDQFAARLSLEQFGALVRLWMALLKTEKPVPNDPAELDFLTGSRTAAERRAVQVVVKRFFTVSEGGKTLESDYCTERLAEYRAAVTQSRWANLCRHWEKANRNVPKPTFEVFAQNPDVWFEPDTGMLRKVTARNLFGEPEEPGTVQPGQPAGSQPRSNNQKPETSNTPIPPKGGDGDGAPSLQKLSLAVYMLYPRKEGRDKALKAIERVLAKGAITELELQARTRAYAEAVAAWPKEERRFIPMPATWFNQGRYDDDPANWIRDTAQPTHPPKKEGGGGPLLFNDAPTEASEPPGWREMWDELFTGHCPDDWANVPTENARAILDELKKNKGGAAR